MIASDDAGPALTRRTYGSRWWWVVTMLTGGIVAVVETPNLLGLVGIGLLCVGGYGLLRSRPPAGP